MDCYIRIVDGVPYEHPIIQDNMVEAFPNVDLNNLPPEFAKFSRTAPPDLQVYKKNLTAVYGLVEGSIDTYTDVFSWEDMTVADILIKQDLVKIKWAISPNWSSWTFNEVTCVYEPPVAMPTDGLYYIWNEEALAWAEDL